MNKYEKQALGVFKAMDARALNEAAPSGAGWCETALEIAEFLDKVADDMPAWKFWIKPGLRLAAEVIRGLRGMLCTGT